MGMLKRGVAGLNPTWLLAVAIGAAAAAPVVARAVPMASVTGPTSAGVAFPGWPKDFEGARLEELPLTPREAAFASGFPGRIGRFTDGRREIILRWVAAPTRRLHPASDCLRAVGFAITPLPARQAEGGGNEVSSCFRARAANDTGGPPSAQAKPTDLRVCERIYAVDGSASWPDASSWYWSAFTGTAHGPWWAVTIAETQPRGDPSLEPQ